jgi:small subunit ribosomal protein S7
MSRKNLKHKKTKNLYSFQTVTNDFCGSLSFRGKKAVQEKVFLKALNSTTNKDIYSSLSSLRGSIQNVRPSIGIKVKKSSRNSQHIPYPLSTMLSNSTAIKWISQSTRKKKGGYFSSNLAKEFNDVNNFRGSSMERKLRHYKLAEENRNLSNTN